jgi:sigma-B regulation protein RsbU (phosphoserine phosphatase)
LCYDNDRIDTDVDTEGVVEHTLTRRRILVVDDDEKVVLSLRLGLKTLPNCETTTATDGHHALQLCEEEAFDLLITDYQMPGMDGIAPAKHVRRLYPQTASS